MPLSSANNGRQTRRIKCTNIDRRRLLLLRRTLPIQKQYCSYAAEGGKVKSVKPVLEDFQWHLKVFTMFSLHHIHPLYAVLGSVKYAKFIIVVIGVLQETIT